MRDGESLHLHVSCDVRWAGRTLGRNQASEDTKVKASVKANASEASVEPRSGDRS
jgi:hypothetical protein